MARPDSAPAPLHPIYSRAERLADTVMHITGVTAALIAVPVMITLASVWHGDAPTITAAAIYGVGLIGVFAASAGYHMVRHPRWKEWLRRLDHSAIYFKIAATYTPFAVIIAGVEAAWILVGIWAAALVGMSVTLFVPRRLEWLTLALYLAMGWSVLVIGGPILADLSTPALVLIVVGGGLYTIGVVFHLWERLPYQNAIWHGFVLAASFVFYAAILVEVVGHAHGF